MNGLGRGKSREGHAQRVEGFIVPAHSCLAPDHFQRGDREQPHGDPGARSEKNKIETQARPFGLTREPAMTEKRHRQQDDG